MDKSDHLSPSAESPKPFATLPTDGSACDLALTSSAHVPSSHNDGSPSFPSLSASSPALLLLQESSSSAAVDAEANGPHKEEQTPPAAIKIPLKWLERGKETEHVVQIKGLSESGQVDSVKTDLESMSITPRCIQERDYGSALLGSENRHGAYFVETYSLKVEGRNQIIVRRFGINLRHESVKSAWREICSGYDKAENQPKYVPPLTNVESVVLELASSQIKSSDEGAEAEVFDLFIRNRKYSKENQSTPETHSATLVKAKGHVGMLLVLDPNNSELSSVLTSADIRAIKHSYRVYKRVSPYDGEEKTGRRSNQFRDCIDIAVKLAFRCCCEGAAPEIRVTDCETDLSEHRQRRSKIVTNNQQPPSTPLILPTSAVKWNFIKKVTNQVKIDEDLLAEVQKHPWRAGQSSDFAMSDTIRDAVRNARRYTATAKGKMNPAKLENALGSTDLSLYDLSYLEVKQE